MLVFEAASSTTSGLFRQAGSIHSGVERLSPRYAHTYRDAAQHETYESPSLELAQASREREKREKRWKTMTHSLYGARTAICQGEIFIWRSLLCLFFFSSEGYARRLEKFYKKRSLHSAHFSSRFTLPPSSLATRERDAFLSRNVCQDIGR